MAEKGKRVQLKATNVVAQKKISKRDSQGKASILVACHELIKSSEKVQQEIRAYSDGISNEHSEEKQLLDELSQTARSTARTAYRMKKKMTHELEGNGIFYPHQREKSATVGKKNRFETVFFYSLLLFIVVAMSAAFNGKSDSGVPRNIVGYAPMTILTRSMQSVYPQHSLVVTKVTEPKELAIGDDITYIKENNTTVTHRIIGINENYMDTGERGFETKGVENPRKDEEVIRAENVIGKVVFSSIVLGEILLFVREKLVLTAITVIVLIYFVDALIHYIRTYLVKKK
ncbi:putative Type I signal peptidase [Carnobacterium maltaromaticum]|uniref:signal peptidase I n=1 Tax=Carnobacterium maltaromaticum TaxID=2751 RepID=UPI00191BBEEB|nr:signal peptidase I [Carnobacterium maltaromaticum]CAD5896355.1 putative Type I signal peptidase [Carnobacterium maltaromaticum]